ncbi:MAG TPA: hypothetical protein VGI64_11955 [Streptosporangiaceae bacterium]
MNAPGESRHLWQLLLDYTPFPDLRKGLRGSWQAPARSGSSRLIPPWVYRHPRFFGAGHMAGGSIAVAAGLICLSYGVYGWAALFLVIGLLHVAGGYWYLTVAHSAAART